MNLVIIKLYMILQLIVKILGESQCHTPAGLIGECKLLKKCEPLLQILTKQDRTKAELQFLRDSSCGFSKNEVMVCCQRPDNPRRCFTPEAKEGNCTGLKSCPSMMKLLNSKVPRDDIISYVKNSRCNSSEEYSVCCKSGDIQCISTTEPPNPKSGCCGQSFYDDKIIGGQMTDIDQYPWLVIIEYIIPLNSEIKLLCGGALISGKYVLTAGHCVSGPVLNHGIPTNVRVGEYDIDNPGIDCTTNRDCNNGAMVIPIEEMIPHEDYRPNYHKYDIALLRLQKLVPYSDFIRPICLPSVDITMLKDDLKFYSAGWGAVNSKQNKSNIKLHIDLPYVPKQNCQSIYKLRRIELFEDIICAGGVYGKDTCKGDSGGPLMYDNGEAYDLIGITSFGAVDCGHQGLPGAYTKVYDYLPWIRAKINP